MATTAHCKAPPLYTHAELNIDRLLRDVESRLATLEGAAGRDTGLRLEVMDALREAIARERRGLDPSFTVEWERERRQSAEQLRGALEAIHGSVRPDEALDEVLKQLGRVVHADFSLVAVAEPGTGLRVAAVNGAEAARLVGTILADPRLDAAGEERRAVRVRDAEAEGPLALAGAPPLRSWVALPLLLEGDVVGMLVAGRLALDTFTDEDLLRAKAVAFWAAAALRRVQLQDQVRRYATLLEQVVEVDQRVFRGEGPEALVPRDPRGGVPHRRLPRGVARPADAAGAGGGRELRRRPGRGRRAQGTRGPGVGGGPPPASRPDAGRRRVAGHGAAGRAGLPRAPRDARRLGGVSRPPRPERGVPGGPAPRGLRLARGRRLAPRSAAPGPPVRPASSG